MQTHTETHTTMTRKEKRDKRDQKNVKERRKKTGTKGRRGEKDTRSKVMVPGTWTAEKSGWGLCVPPTE